MGEPFHLRTNPQPRGNIILAGVPVTITNITDSERDRPPRELAYGIVRNKQVTRYIHAVPGHDVSTPDAAVDDPPNGAFLSPQSPPAREGLAPGASASQWFVAPIRTDSNASVFPALTGPTGPYCLWGNNPRPPSSPPSPSTTDT